MDLAACDQLLTTTRSVRKRLDFTRPVPLYATNPAFRPRYAEGDPRSAQRPRVEDSARYLAEHLHEAPALVVPCIEGRVEAAGVLAQASIYGSILPAAWSFMLALRARGLGSAWTTLHLMYEKDAAAALGLPDHVTQCALLPVAYTKGSGFRVAKRLPLARVLHWERW